jgi:amino acid adenylation domain-containing protein
MTIDTTTTGSRVVVETSFAQQSLWLLDQVDPGQPTYNVLASVRLRGTLDAGALERALAAVVERHEALRTVFAFDGVEPVQVIHDRIDVTMPVSEVAADALDDTVQAEIERPFDLTTGPLLRMRLLRLAPDEHVAVLVMHHIVTDGISSAILFHELATCYEAFLAGRRPRLPELRVQYADYAVWQRETLQGQALAEQVGYWRDQLAGTTPLLLPTDHARPAAPTAAGATHSFLLPDGCMARIERMARNWEVTPFMLVLGVFSVLLHRYTGRADLTVATPAAGRQRSEIAALIGFFVNTLVLRVDLAGDPTFGQLLGRVKRTALDGYANQDVPYETLVQELRPPRYTGNGGPFAQVMCSMLNVPQDGWRAGGLVFEPMPVATRTAKFDLSLDISPLGAGYLLSLEYSTELFTAATVEAMAGHLMNLLDAALDDADQRVSELPLLPAGPAGPPVGRDPGHCLHRLVERQAAATPAAPAVVCGPRVLDYAELDRRANRLARRLRARGVRAEDPVVIYLPRSPELVVAFLAVLKAGGAYLPADPGYPPERLAHMIGAARARHAVTIAELAADLPAAIADPVVLELAGDGPGGDDTPLGLDVHPDQLAYVVFTSGSTGRPKGAMNTHRGLSRFALDMAGVLGLTATDRALQLAPLGFDVVAEEVFPYLCTGGSVALPDGDAPLETAGLWALVEATGATTLSTTPSRLLAMDDRDRAAVPACLRRLIFGSEAAPTLRGLAGWRDWAGDLVQVYGVTEACCTSSVLPVDHTGPADLVVPLGPGLPGTQLLVLDGWLRPVPQGVPGELFLGGETVGRGYVAGPAATAERFVPHPDRPGERLYRTGDLVRTLPGGGFRFLGRDDAQVKIRGFRVEPGEVEAVLAEHPDVAGCAVVAHPDPTGAAQLVAYVVARPGTAPPAASVRGFLGTRVPEWMVPAVVVPIAELPTGANGKIDRSALARPRAERAEVAYVAPRTPVEEELARIWAELLGLDRVGVESSFFDLGGNSLAAVRMTAGIREALAVELPLKTLFATEPTIAALGELILARAGTAQAAPATIPRLPRDGRTYATSGTERLYWDYHEADPDRTTFVLVGAIRMDGPLDVEQLRHTLDALAERHESLRTRFRIEDGELVAVVDPAASLGLDVVDIAEEAVDEVTAAVFEEPFDVRAGPLLRLRVLRTAPDRHVLVLVMHHLIGDLRSMEVFCGELSAGYAARLAGTVPALDPLPVQPIDIAAWQRDRVDRDRDRLEGYWARRLAGAQALRPPTDLTAPDRPGTAGHTRGIRVPDELVERLRGLGAESHASLFMVTLTAFGMLLGAYSGQRDVVLMTPISLRDRPETHGVLGVHINEPPIRIDLSGDPTFRELLARVRDDVAADLDHRDLPVARIGELVEGGSLPLPVLFTEETDPDVPVDGAGAAGTLTQWVPYGRSQGQFAMRVTGGVYGVHLIQTYRTELYSESRVAAIAEDFLDVLAGVADRPDHKVLDPTGPCGIPLRVPRAGPRPSTTDREEHLR